MNMLHCAALPPLSSHVSNTHLVLRRGGSKIKENDRVKKRRPQPRRLIGQCQKYPTNGGDWTTPRFTQSSQAGCKNWTIFAGFLSMDMAIVFVFTENRQGNKGLRKLSINGTLWGNHIQKHHC